MPFPFLEVLRSLALAYPGMSAFPDRPFRAGRFPLTLSFPRRFVAFSGRTTFLECGLSRENCVPGLWPILAVLRSLSMAFPEMMCSQNVTIPGKAGFLDCDLF